jgi:hypothetical protein
MGKRLLAFWRNRVKPFWREYEVPVLMAVGIIAFAMGVVGFGDYFKSQNMSRPPLDWIFLTIMMFRGIILQPGPLPLELEIARWVAIFIVLYAAVRALMALFYEQMHLLILRWLTSGHVVICGLGEKGARVAREFYKRGYSVAIIEKTLSKEMAQKCKEEGAVILNGNAIDVELLRRARIDRAKYLISALGDDGANAEVALSARELISREGRKGGVPLTCYVHIVDRTLCNLLKVDYEFSRNKNNLVRLEYFNVFDEGAKALLREYPPFGGNATGFAVVGMGKLSESLVLRAATDWLFFEGRQGRRLNVMLIDAEASKKSAGLATRYPLLESTCSIVACDVDALRPEACVLGLSDVSVIYVCPEKDSDCLTAALAMRRSLKEEKTGIVACMGQSSGLSRLVENIGKEQGFGGLGFFSLPDAVALPEVILGGTREAIAMAIHEDYVRSQLKTGITLEANPSMAAWEKLPEDLKESNRHNADHIFIKLAAVDCAIELLTSAGALDFKFSPEEVEKIAVLEHERWCEERRRQGWAYAPEKDIGKKTSPYLVAWEKLAEEIKEYDRNVARGMPVFLGRAGFKIYRMRPVEPVVEAPVLVSVKPS